VDIAVWRAVADNGAVGGPRAHDAHHGAVGGRDGQRAADHARARAGLLAQLDAGQHRGDHDLQLVERERHPDAAPRAAAEGEPLVGVAAPPEPALRREALGVREEVLAALGEVHRRQHPRAARDRP
jgi:hypothetical protein